MKKVSAYKIFFSGLTLAVLCFYVAHSLHKKQENFSESNLDKVVELSNQYLESLHEEGKTILNEELSWEEIQELAVSADWEVYRFEQNKITQWSTNEWLPDSSAINGSRKLVKHASGWEIVLVSNHKKYILAHPIIRFAQGSFEYRNFIKPLKGYQFELSDQPNSYQIWNNTHPVYVGFYGKNSIDLKPAILHLVGWLILLITFLYAFHFWIPGTVIISLISLILRLLAQKPGFHSGLDILTIFDPMIFATSKWLPSLGDLSLHVLTAGFMVYSIRKLLLLKIFEAQSTKTAATSVIVILAFFAADLIRSLITSLVRHSNISFDVTNLPSLSWSTAVAGITVFAMFWLFWFFLASWYSPNRLNAKNNFISWKEIVIWVLGAAAFIIFQILDANRSLVGLLPALLFTLLSLLLVSTYWKKGLYRYVVYLILISSFFTLTLIETQFKRETEYLNHYAAKLISNKDLEAEYLFQDIEKDLVEEFLQPEDFEGFANKKDQFEKRLRRLYFSGYLDRYNLLVMSFDSVGNNINSSTRYTFEDLNYLYNFQAFPTLSNHFYQVKSTEVFNGYLAKFENCDLNGHYGNIFILLEPKFIQSSYEYPQLAQKKPDHKIIDLDDYSYAIYNRGKLMHQKGSYSYDLILDSSRLMKHKLLGKRSTYYHYLSRQDETSLVVLSHPDSRTLTMVSTANFIVLFFGLLWVCTAAIWWASLYFTELILKKKGNVKRYHSFRYRRLNRLSRLGLDQVLLSTRIRISMVSLVLVGLLISLYVTIQFIRINDQKRAENELMYKIREVANQIQNEVDVADKLQQPEARQLIVNEVGDVYKVEANIFDAQGYLLATSVEDLYQNRIAAPVMNPFALRKMRDDRSSQIIQYERLRNIKFTSAYIPLLNEQRQVIAYLNLPYFTRQNLLDQEISSYAVTFVNLYLFLMILAFALAFIVSQRITKPLKIIRDKMSTTGLGNQNDMIEWRQNDEIGRLVQQYNKMVLQLEESAEKLSASEREGAWKEMARQVAHEIKNPLTPMKLNIQHLQRAWSDKSTKLESTFKRVTEVLIEQIDGLSRLAGEFSSFANMPVDNFESCNLSEILLNTIVLFEKTDNVLFNYSDKMEPAFVHADKNHLSRIFSNLIKNAIQSIPENRKGRIEIEHKISDGYVHVQIRDNGSGIPKEIQPKIFVPNFSTKTSGMGLGLAMTKKMTEACNGKIRFETKEGIGTTFFLYFPLHKE